jgi:two-component sensor histidine kinase
MPSNLVWDAPHLQTAIDAAQVGLWSWNVDTDELQLDDRSVGLWGLTVTGCITFEDLSLKIHPKDLDRVRSAFAATRRTLGTFEIDFRIKLVDEIRWISARGQGDDKGIALRQMFGVFLDVSQRKQAEEANQLLASEMSHRVKNLLAIALALTRIAASSTTTTKEMADDLGHRLMALGRAHDLVRATDGGATKSALLGDLFSVLLSPYDIDHTGMSAARRVRVSLPRLGVGEQAITSLALIVHELATNSLKYGALSGSNGTLDVSATTRAGDEDVNILWAERGGPPVEAPPTHSGFGSRMVARAVSHALGGSIAFDWSKEGVIVTLQLDLKCLSR